MNKTSRIIMMLLTAVVVIVGLAACSNNAATTTDKCAFVVGDGQDGRDAKIHKVIYPGQKMYIGDHENARYFPCNSRNYIINNGDVKNGNHQQVGDRFNLSVGYTKQHTKMLVGVTAYWTLNETKSVLQNEFAPLCLKYKCYSSDSSSGDANFSTPGWNGMLGENFGQSIDQDMLSAASNFDDSLWRNQDPTLKKQLEEALSKGFAQSVRQTTGYTDDLFCGSGNSGWKDPNRPGSGDFTCTNVRFVVTSIQPADSTIQDQTTKVNGKQAQTQANQDELDIAKAKYGKSASFWLGVQDTMSKCRSGSTCNVYVGTAPGTK